MIKIINLKAHCGHFAGRKDQIISNGEIGIGYDKENKIILVVCCGNCGDYFWVNLEDLLKDLPK